MVWKMLKVKGKKEGKGKAFGPHSFPAPLAEQASHSIIKIAFLFLNNLS